MNRDKSPECHPTGLLDCALARTFKGEPQSNWGGHIENRFHYPPQPDLQEITRVENPIVIDCWKYGENLKEPCTSHLSYIDDKDIENWAKQPFPSQDGKPPRAGLRLLHKCFHRNQYSQEMIATLSKAFGIPHVQLSISLRESGVCTRIHTPDSNHPVFVCRAPIGAMPATTVVMYNPQMNMTLGYILSGSQSEIHNNLAAIPAQFNISEHPLLVPVLMTEHFLEVVGGLMYGLELRLKLIEPKIEPRNLLSVVIQPPYKPRQYKAGIAEWLGAEAREFALCKAQIQAAILRNTFLAEQLDQIDTWMPSPILKASQNSTSMLMERTAYIRSNLEHLKVESGIELRIDALKTLTSNRLAQQDNQINIQISREMKQIAIKSKKDSSIMKLIAILGALFLPSTFVSTFFSMPFFDWHAPNASDVAGKYFWLYWAVTTPLTLFTTILVGAWILVRNGTVSNGRGEFDPTNGPETEGGIPDIQKESDTSDEPGPWNDHSTNPRHLSHPYDRFGKIVQSLRIRKRNFTSKSGNEGLHV